MFRGVGVRGRLLIAFFGISVFAILASAAAFYSFVAVSSMLDRITQRRMPSALNALEIARQAEQIVAVAPSFLTVTTETEREQFSNKIASEVEYLNGLVSGLNNPEVDASAHDAIRRAVDGLGMNLGALDLLVAKRISAHDQKLQLISKLSQAKAAAQRVLTPGLRVMDGTVSQLRRVAENPDISEAERTIALRDLAEAIPSSFPVQKAQVEVSAINDTLRRAASAETLGDIDLLQFPLSKSLNNLAKLFGDLEPRLKQLLQLQAEEFRALVTGSDSLLEARRRELELVSESERLLSENTELSRKLKQAARQLVSAAKEDIAAAGVEAKSVQDFSKGILVLAVALSLISSALIAWLYVGRNLIARLTALSDSMLAIAGGNLKAPLPGASGTDEIARMAEALTVFRNTAIEVEEKNLREIEQAQRRLVDALENTSEGFAFYDARDRLELCNTRYREMLYPGASETIRLGMTFEEIIRTAMDKGLVASAEGRREEWLAERLARHRDPGEPHLQQRSDGRWILVSEHRTDYGGTVAVYSDITDLKKREQELAEKSNALEEKSNALQQLSIQLSKYLSPQVYNSIFQGQQEVKIVSRRKKLTIFFSDIVGFTEAADRLESEELSELLNHYLTEMSQIALEYGATIDKYVGDAILIFFGDPETKGVKEDAVACVRMAIAMRTRMRELEQLWRRSGIEKPLQVRMGIHTGYCTVGNFGSEDRMDYTIVGGAVNTASRLESQAAPGEILISYETFVHISDQIFCEERGRVEVKGIAYPVGIYRVIDTKKNVGRERRRFREEHTRVTLDLDLDAMTADERSHVAAILRQGLDLLFESGDAATSKQVATKNSGRE